MPRRPRRRAATAKPARIKPLPGKTAAAGVKLALGRRVRELRESAGLTQRQLAGASGISGVFLGTVERGEKAATVETIEKLAHGLDVPPAVLFAFDAPVKLDAEDGAAKLARK